MKESYQVLLVATFIDAICFADFSLLVLIVFVGLPNS
jgi:hypothetical protein